MRINQETREHIKYRDLLCLDLEKQDGWRQLPEYPISERVSGLFKGFVMTVYESKAYLFTGRPQLDVFDLVTEEWSTVTTRMKDATTDWPYEGNEANDYTMQLVEGTLYVFGGSHSGSMLGCNVLMALDLSTLQWQHLSGTSKLKADYSCPGPRIYAMSWASSDRLYVMYGMANRTAAQLHRQPEGADLDYPFDDLWSWSIPERTWRRERIRGNPPSPRCESAYVYVSHLDPSSYYTIVTLCRTRSSTKPSFSEDTTLALLQTLEGKGHRRTLIMRTPLYSTTELPFGNKFLLVDSPHIEHKHNSSVIVQLPRCICLAVIPT